MHVYVHTHIATHPHLHIQMQYERHKMEEEVQKERREIAELKREQEDARGGLRGSDDDSQVCSESE
jgi:hypothetical protein